MNKVFIDCVTGEVTEIPLNEKEISDYQKKIENNEAEFAAELENKKNRIVSRLALLAKLGITAEEAALLLS